MTAPPSPQSLLEHADFLRRLARAMLRDEHEAEDLVQETFTSALSARRGPRGDVRGWLVGIARNLARGIHRSRARRHTRERRAAQSVHQPSAAQEAARAETHTRLARAVARLPEPGRSIVIRRFLGAESATAIARDLGVTPKTVRVHLRRSLTHLRGILDAHSERSVWTAALATAAAATGRAAVPMPVVAAGAVAVVALAAWGVATVLPDPAPPRVVTAARQIDDPQDDPARATRPARKPGPLEEPGGPKKSNTPAEMDKPHPITRSGGPNTPAPDTEPKTSPSVPDVSSEPPPQVPVAPTARRVERPKPVAGIRNGPQTPLPKMGLTVGWGPDRFLRSTGQHTFVVVSRDGQAVDYEVWTRKPASAAPRSTRDLAAHARFLAKGRLNQVPWLFHVMDTEPGFVVFERYNHHGRGRVLMVVDATGHLRWTRDLEEIFGAAERTRFPEGDHETMWTWRGQGFWVDERARRIVLMTARRDFKAVDLDTGVVTPAHADALLPIIRAAHATPRDRARAIDAAAAFRLPALRKLVRTLAADSDEPLRVRLHAAGAALYDGGPPPDRAVFRAAAKAKHLAVAARRLLKEADERAGLRGTIAALAEKDASKRRAARALLRDHYGPAALPLLRTRAGDARLPARARLRALHAYGLIQPDARLAAETPVLLLQGFLAVHEDRPLQLWCARRLPAFETKAAVLLRAFVLDHTQEIQARREAAACLASFRTKITLEALFEVAGDKDFIIMTHAHNGLLGWPQNDRNPKLLALLRQKTRHADTIALIFSQQPNKQATEPLLRAFERHVANGGAKKSHFPYALQRCSGKWIEDGKNPAAWRRALGLD